jgi:hypothetical protein
MWTGPRWVFPVVIVGAALGLLGFGLGGSAGTVVGIIGSCVMFGVGLWTCWFLWDERDR